MEAQQLFDLTARAVAKPNFVTYTAQGTGLAQDVLTLLRQMLGKGLKPGHLPRDMARVHSN